MPGGGGARASNSVVFGRWRIADGRPRVNQARDAQGSRFTGTRERCAAHSPRSAVQRDIAG
jgi:hypothetical protein